MFMLYVPETDTLEIVYREALGPVDEPLPGPKEWGTMDVDEEGHLDLKATYDAADTSLSPSTTAESGSRWDDPDKRRSRVGPTRTPAGVCLYGAN